MLHLIMLHQSAPPIATLSLEWNNIGTTDAGPKALAAALAVSRSLTSLDVRNNHLGPTAVAALADGIARSATLRSVDLRWNAAGVSGGHALEEALKNNHAMLRAQLSGNRVPAECLERIEARLARNGGHAAGLAARDMDSAIARTPPAARGAKRSGDATVSTSLVYTHGGGGGGGGGSGGGAGGGLGAAVRTATLESAMALQQAEFSSKLSHASGRVR